MPEPTDSPVAVVLPDTLWEPQGDEEAVLVAWLAPDGAAVTEGAVIAEVMVDKVTIDVAAPASGRLAIVTPAEARVHLGDVIAKIYP